MAGGLQAPDYTGACNPPTMGRGQITKGDVSMTHEGYRTFTSDRVIKLGWRYYFKHERKLRKANIRSWYRVYRKYYHVNPLRAIIAAHRQTMPVFDI